jgi:hypothetical protein
MGVPCFATGKKLKRKVRKGLAKGAKKTTERTQTLHYPQMVLGRAWLQRLRKISFLGRYHVLSG